MVISMPSNNILLPLLLLLLLLPSLSYAADLPKTVLAVYMIGSDLEYDPNLTVADNAALKLGATKDIKEMVSGWGEGSADLGVIIGYGGSKKKGWEGLTVATIEDLKKDLDDDIIGNAEGDYYQGWIDCNMASSEGIANFLKAVNTLYPKSRLILILWDHGEAWEGVGPDAFYPDRLMTPVDFRNAQQSMNQKVDLLGLDACFMANIEYLRIIAPYVHYAVASEDTEPEHGWNYASLIAILKENPDIQTEDLGKRIVDSYLDSPDHQKGALSLSLLDLSRMQDLLTAFDDLTTTLSEASSDSGSYQVSSHLVGNLSAIGAGKDTEGNDVAIMVDLSAIVDSAEKGIPAVQEKADACSRALKNVIVYSRSDSSVTQIHGLGIFSPVMASHPVFYHKMQPGTILDLTNGWTRFVTTLADQILADSTPPQLQPKSGGYQIVEDGYTFVTDVYYQILPDSSKIVLAQEPALRGEENLILTPEWGGTGSFLTNGNSSSLLPVYYVQTNDAGVQLYYSWGVLVQGGRTSSVRINLWYDPVSNTLNYNLQPYSINTNGEQEFARSVATPRLGDLFIIYSLVITPEGVTTFTEIGRVTWSEGMTIKTMKMPCGEYGLQVMATDLAGNTGQTEIIPYSIQCNGIITN